ncbi:hypothetical protein ACVIWV_006861 [Bradyrhizobium diazoefficiens]
MSVGSISAALSGWMGATFGGRARPLRWRTMTSPVDRKVRRWSNATRRILGFPFPTNSYTSPPLLSDLLSCRATMLGLRFAKSQRLKLRRAPACCFAPPATIPPLMRASSSLKISGASSDKQAACPTDAPVPQSQLIEPAASRRLLTLLHHRLNWRTRSAAAQWQRLADFLGPLASSLLSTQLCYAHR